MLTEHWHEFIPEARTLHNEIRPVTQKPRDKSLSHNQRDKTANNVELRLKRQSAVQVGLCCLIQISRR
jgi:hypothetical protein